MGSTNRGEERRPLKKEKRGKQHPTLPSPPPSSSSISRFSVRAVDPSSNHPRRVVQASSFTWQPGKHRRSLQYMDLSRPRSEMEEDGGG